jgi:2-phospho-L-lactate guanylyltransferase
MRWNHGTQWPVWRDNGPRKGKDGTVSWSVIVPVKRLDVAKSRLRGALMGVDHNAVVMAMALDTVAAALASPVVGRIIVVASDAEASTRARELGAEVVLDVPDAGLNSALAYAATHVRRTSARSSGVVALAGDLPSLRTDDVTDALGTASSRSRSFVTDAAGTGTVLLAAPPEMGLEPCFGEGSAAAHLVSGAIELTGVWPSLRRDVDTAADLAAAIVLGLGPRTAAVAALTSRPEAARAAVAGSPGGTAG